MAVHFKLLKLKEITVISGEKLQKKAVIKIV